MKKINLLVLIGILVIGACSNVNDKAIIGKWDAGKAAGKSRIWITFKSQGDLSVEITETGMRPVQGKYRIKDRSLIITFPTTKFTYEIEKLDKKECIIVAEHAKITWRRIE